jgi:hypothetical protein
MRRLSSFLASCAVIGLLAGSTVGSVAAQDTSFADHPVVGAWMAKTPIGPALNIFHADGTMVFGVAASQAGPEGVTYASPQVGAWEPTGERTMHFTSVYLMSDAAGAFTGTVTVDAHQEVSADGQTWVATEGTVTIRDAAGNITFVVPPGGEPATGIRISVGSPGFPEASPAAPSPTP